MNALAINGSRQREKGNTALIPDRWSKSNPSYQVLQHEEGMPKSNDL